MPRTRDEILRDICADPASDELRLEFARAVQAKDPRWAAYIREEIRAGREGATRGNWEDVERRVSQEARSWDIMIPLKNRGFVEHLIVDPFRFLARADEYLSKAPIRYLTCRPHADDDAEKWKRTPPPVPSPIPEMMASPHLLRLRGLTFTESYAGYYRTTPEDLEHVLRSPYLENMRWLDLPHGGRVGADDDAMWRRIYDLPQFRRMQRITIQGVPDIREIWTSKIGDYEDVTRPLSPLAQELEERYGYIPSLHVREWEWGRFWDAGLNAYDQGKLARYPVGTPVTPEMVAPTRRVISNTDHY